VTPEEWEAWYEEHKDNLRAHLIREVLGGMFRRAEPFEHPTWTTDNGREWASEKAKTWSAGGGTWPHEPGKTAYAEWDLKDTPLGEEPKGGNVPGTPGVDIVKIVYETRFSEGIKMPYHGSTGAMRCYAEMWRGEQHVREPINVGKMEEFVTELKDEGFKEQRHPDCIHYLWRKRT
jgi:hypothetical protein